MKSCKRSLILLISLAILAAPLLANNQELSDDATDWKTREAVEKGLAFIVANQDEKKGCFGPEREQVYAIAITSFSCLALMAHGNLPGRGKYGANVEKGINYILSCVEPGTGFITAKDEKSRMHGHCYATLMLAQAYGMSPDPKLRKKLKKAVTRIIRSQIEEKGKEGWGYYLDSNYHEGSITVCALQALRSARNAGIHVPKRSIDNALRYLRNSANPDGSFKYRLGMTSRRRSFPLTAAGVSSLNATGEYESKEVKNGLQFMMQYLPPDGKRDQYYTNFYYYGHFYAVQAMYQAPPHYWQKWFPAIRDELLDLQSSDGSWGKFGRGYSRFGRVYATAIATLILQVPYGYLPIFQR